MAASSRSKAGRFVKKSVAERNSRGTENLLRSHAKKKEAKEQRTFIHEVGRRVVDLTTFAKNMWCDACGEVLSLSHMEKEVRRGLASVFYVRCRVCLELKQVPTDSAVKHDDGYPLYSVNCKAALGCLDTGIGHEQINSWLTAVNIPAIMHSTIKRAERFVGPAVEEVARESCRDAIQEEKELTLQSQKRPLAPSDAQNRCDVGETPKKRRPCSSQQEDENVATRVPKSRFYCSSTANKLRVAAAVCQKNRGAAHVVEINQKCGLSPGGVTMKYRKLAEERRQKKCALQQTVQFRRRRLLLKGNADRVSNRVVAREGLTYVSGMGNTMERAVAAATDTFGSWMPLQKPLEDHCQFVIVDIETTGFGAGAQIVQVAAKCQMLEFSQYMMPTTSFNHIASEKTGLSVHGGQLMYNSKRVDTSPPAQVARDFMDFLHKCGQQVILVGHNIVRFDAPHIVKWLHQFGVTAEFCDLVYGFTDTVPIIRQGKVQKQDLLAQQYLTGPEWQHLVKGAHNAATDCVLLSGLLEHFNIEHDIMRGNALPIRTFFERQQAAKRRHITRDEKEWYGTVWD
ncbi:maternal exuperantia-like, partial [Olea europaea subsp. europaea]